MSRSDASPMNRPSPDDLSRYVRQTRYAPLGEEGQRSLLAGRALICGCGALGSVLANTLARAGVGHLRIVDRDFLELNNLQRQVLFDEADVAEGLPKAMAAKRRLERINSQIEIEAIVADVSASNIASLVEGCDVMVDGTDNFETRHLLNEAALKFNIPWVYGGCIGAEGQTMTILPGETPCFRCIQPETPPPGATPTCDSAGILGPVVNVVASLQACEAIKILSGRGEAISRTLTVFDLWESRFRQVKLDAVAAAGGCRACGQRDFEWLDGRRGSHTAVLCGRNAVQLSYPDREPISLGALAAQLEGVGVVKQNKYLLRLSVDDYTLTVFPDGRAIIGGTDDPSEARTVYAKYIGH